MGDELVSKWNARYAYSGDSVPPPAEVLSRFAGCLPDAIIASSKTSHATTDAPSAALSGATRRKALDLACGRAGNGEWLGARGFDVTAWDSSTAVIDAIRQRPGSRIATAEVRNVLVAPPDPDSFDVIVVARFLERQICPMLAAALCRGGLLYYQTFTAGLSNADFLLNANELPGLFPSLTIRHYRETNIDAAGKAEAMLVAAGPPAVRETHPPCSTSPLSQPPRWP